MNKNPLLKELSWINQTPQIAHYTSLQGLCGILSTKTIWATHYRFLNDFNELEHGKKYINQIHQQNITKYQNINSQPCLLENPSKLDELWWQQTIATRSNNPEFFITSFSGVKNKSLAVDGLLSQWRGYGKDGGFALIFDSKEITQSYAHFSKTCTKHNEHYGYNCEDCKIHFFSNYFIQAKYEHDFHSFKEEYPEIYENIDSYSKNSIKYLIAAGNYGISPTRYDPHELQILVERNVRAVLFTLLSFKHNAFHEENEIRFACLNRLERESNGYYNKSPYDIEIINNAPRLKIHFLPKSLKKILIGPQQDQDKMKILINYQLEKNQFENFHNIKIIKSSIPYKNLI